MWAKTGEIWGDGGVEGEEGKKCVVHVMWYFHLCAISCVSGGLLQAYMSHVLHMGDWSKRDVCCV